MANVCSDAGPLGATVRHPGPVIAWHRDGFMFPTWLHDGLLQNPDDRARRFGESMLPVHPLLEWSVEDELRFGA